MKTQYQRAKRLHRRIIGSNDYLRWGWWHVQVHLSELRQRDAVVVYQMGKVGSSTVVATLRAARPELQIHHVHTLTKAGIAAEEATYRQLARHTRENVLTKGRHLMHSRYLQERIHHKRHGKKWKVISLTREPVARNISSFFQMIDYPLPYFMERYNAGEIDIGTAVKVFLEQFDHKHALNWFTAELYPTLGIDVFASEFPKQKGYKIYRGENCELLVLKLEKLDECIGDAFNDFLDIDEFAVQQSNIAEDKEYAVAYREFKQHLGLPDSYLETVYSSRFAQHFYGAHEIDAFADKWKSSYARILATSR